MPRKTLTLLGILLILSELGGLPREWKTIYGVFVGIVLVFLAFRNNSSFQAAENKTIESEESSFKNVMTEGSSEAYAEAKSE
ncbi:MAG: hypothetical protein HYV68_03195 [Candidatus Taylorbacteria bacterium]|nr:hypothetical protein [Candidatus Taylorbacteria bacterium]